MLGVRQYAALAAMLCFGWAAAQIATPAPPASTAGGQVARGAYLATAGDCQYCHSVPGGAPYSGGQPLESPFGAMYSPNITPDKTYGIGNWTDADFYNAVHNGIGKGHSLLVFPKYLYPVMPWQDYSKLTYQDVMALKAYLDTVPPAAVPNRPTDMHFPFTLRAGLLGWRILFFHPQPMQYDPSWSPQVRNGAYLVQALGHCAECHTERNLLMAVKPSRTLAGGQILAQSWYAPDITSSPDGVGNWNRADLVTFLSKDGAPGTGSAYGPMAEVVHESLSHLPPSDIQDIAAYLQTATTAKPAEQPTANGPTANGATIYADNCARCHGANGEGVAQNFPNLAGNPSLAAGPGDDIESMILGGFQPWHENQSAMPAFAALLNNTQVATLTNYIRTAWGNHGAPDATAAQVASIRQAASIFATLNTATTQADLNGTKFDDISGSFELFGDRAHCMLTNAVFTAPKQKITLAGACGQNGSALSGQMTINGQPFLVHLSMQNEGNAAMRFFGQAAGQTFDLNIRLTETVD
jgi:mono/diheme cytochrome c family protein